MSERPEHEPANGSCLCGAVRFEVSGTFDSFFLCHCSRCRKDSGSAHAANLFSAQAHLIWLSGEDTVRSFQLPGTEHVKAFCSQCGSALPYSLARHGTLVVPAGALDSPVTLKPKAHICCASRAEWDTDLGSLDQFDGLPE